MFLNQKIVYEFIFYELIRYRNSQISINLIIKIIINLKTVFVYDTWANLECYKLAIRFIILNLKIIWISNFRTKFECLNLLKSQTDLLFVDFVWNSYIIKSTKVQGLLHWVRFNFMPLSLDQHDLKCKKTNLSRKLIDRAHKWWFQILFETLLKLLCKYVCFS